MPVDSLQEQAGRVAGSRNRATEMAEALIEGEAPAVTRKIVERALARHSTAMRLYFERLGAPRRGRPVRVAMPGQLRIPTMSLGHSEIMSLGVPT